MLNLRDCVEQLARVPSEPLRLAQAAKSVHLAMQAALTEALSGSDSAGAHTPKVRNKWRDYLNGPRNGLADAPEEDRVMSFRDLLAEAMGQPMPWSGQTLIVTEHEKAALDRLTDLRDRIEHVRPGSHLIEPAYLAETLPVAARLTLELLRVVGHRLQDWELRAVERNVAAINALCHSFGGTLEPLRDGR